MTTLHEFHQVKEYYEIMTIKGKRTMVFRASCRQIGCRWIKAYISAESRAKAIARHRRNMIVILRNRLNKP
jgi:hypothetical protein